MARALSSCGARGLLFRVTHRLLAVEASLVAGPRSSRGCSASAVVAHRPESTGLEHGFSCSMESSQTKGQTHVSCTGRQIPTGKVPICSSEFLKRLRCFFFFFLRL